jgi:tape measure domain-containing protein
MATDSVDIDVNINVDTAKQEFMQFREFFKSSFDGTASTASKTEDAVDGVRQAVESVSKATEEMGKKSENGFKTASKSSKGYTAQLKESVGQLTKSSPALSSLGNILKNPVAGGLAIAAAAVAVFVKALAKAELRNAELDEMATKLRIVSAEGGDATKIMDALADSPISAANNFDQLVASATKMATFGVSADNIIVSLEAIGNIAMGDSGKLDALSTAFSKVSASGVLTTRELRQMVESGFNPLAEMSRTTGKSLNALQKDMEAGKITTNMVAEAFRTATTEGGQFNNAALKLSLTTKGLSGTIKDNTTQINANIFAPISAFTKAYKNAFADLTGEFMNFTKPMRAITNDVSRLERLWGNAAVSVETFSRSLKIIYQALKDLVNAFKTHSNELGNSEKKTDTLIVTNAIFLTSLQAIVDIIKIFGAGLNVITSSMGLLGVAMDGSIQRIKVLGEQFVMFLKGDFAGAKEAGERIDDIVKNNFGLMIDVIKQDMEVLAKEANKLSTNALKSSYEANYAALTSTSEEAKRKARLSGEDIGHGIVAGMNSAVNEGNNMAHLAEEALRLYQWLSEKEQKLLGNLMANITSLTDKQVDELEKLMDKARANLERFEYADALAQKVLSMAKWLSKEEQKIFEELNSNIKSLTDKQVSELERLMNKAEENKKNFVDKVIDDMVNNMNQTFDIVGLIFQNQADAVKKANEDAVKSLEKRFKDEKKLTDRRFKDAENEHKEGLISQYEYDVKMKELGDEAIAMEEQQANERAALELENAKKADAIAEKQFNADKANSLAQVGVSTGKAIMGIWASGAPLGIFGLVWAIAQTAIVTGLGATQAALIASKKFVGAFEMGGVIPRQGFALVGERGPELINVSGGERVFNAQDTQRMLNQTNNNQRNITNNFTINAGQGVSGISIANQVNKEIGRVLMGKG